MSELFPLWFKKKDSELSRGLSAVDAMCKEDYLNHCYNPKNIPPRESKYDLTLVWDLDQTLVSADGIGKEDEDDPHTKLVLRPHAEEILSLLRTNENVEFIIWTAGTKSHAKRVIYSFPKIHFDHIISRNSTWYNDDNPIKNLNLITSETRPLSTMILIDDRMDVGKYHPSNLLVVPPYYPKNKHVCTDTTLLYLANIIQRSITEYRKNPNNSFCSYLYSPLSEKCNYKNLHYYGVKCFNNKED